MNRFGRLFRFLTLAFAAVQFALPAALSIADAISAEDGRTSLAHIEDTSRANCAAPHSADCALCSYLATPAAGAAAPSTIVARRESASPSQFVVARTGAVLRNGFLSRAPPGLMT